MSQSNASSIADFPLPEALFAASGPLETQLIDQMKSRLAGLRLQQLVIELAALFERKAELARAVIVFKDRDRGSWLDPLVATNLGYASDTQSDDAKLKKIAKRYGALSFDRRETDPGDAVGELFRWGMRLEKSDAELIAKIEFSRPAQGELLPALMSQALAPDDFARWQAAYLAAHTPAPHAPPRAPAAL